MTTELQKVFLSLVRLGIGNENQVGSDYLNQFQRIDWGALQSLALDQGLSAVVVDGLERLPLDQKPPKPVLLQWIGEVIQGYEYRYELYRRAHAEMASFYNSHGFKMMVLKGYACSLDWPKPEHRPTGDIDIWQFGQQKEADAAIAKEKGITIDSSHHHHTVFYWRDFMVENHYDFINVHHHKSNVELDKILKEQAADDSYSVNVYGEKVYVPSPNLHAFFLLRHTMNHFSSSEISLRQLLDWAFYLEKHGNDVDWNWMMKTIEYFGMQELYGIFSAICIEDLGFKASLFPNVQFNPLLKDKVFDEIISPQFTSEEPKNVLKRVIFKYRRWKANGWKHKLCYQESMWSAFWSGVWSHILKPSSI